MSIIRAIFIHEETFMVGSTNRFCELESSQSTRDLPDLVVSLEVGQIELYD